MPPKAAHAPANVGVPPTGAGDAPPAFGLHEDAPSGPSKMETLFNMLPILMRFAKQIPAFACGFVFCFLVFALWWGRAGIADDIAPYILHNAFGIAALAVFASYYQGWVNSARARKEVKTRLNHGQAAADVFYRAPKLD